LTGNVTYHTRHGLGRGAVLEVDLVELARWGGEGRRIDGTTVRRIGRSPVPFRLTYSPRAIDSRRDYAVVARISEDGRVLFESAGAYLVITKGRPSDVGILMERVGGGPPHDGEPPRRLRINGQVRYGRGVDLPRDAVLYVELRTEGRGGRPGRVVDSGVFRRLDRGPVAFDLTVDRRDIDVRAAHVVVARIERDGRVLYETSRGTPVDVRDDVEGLVLRLESVAPVVPRGPVTGKVRWRPRGDMPRGAVLEVDLWDAGRIGQRGGRLAQHEITRLGDPPAPFRLAYDFRDIDPERDYIVIARVVVGRRVVLRTADTHRVITKGQPMRVEVFLRHAD
jgi:uncharacterized lipoprotein YbaY